MFATLLELLKVLPTKDHEYLDLGDFLGQLRQILLSYPSFLADPASASLSEDFLVRLMDGLRYHLMPYLEETGVSGILESSEFCPKTFLVFRFVELLTQMVICDKSRPRSAASITRDQVSRTSFIQYLVTLYQFYKSNLVLRKTLLGLFEQIIQNFSFSDHQVNQLVSDLLVDQVSTVKMVFDQFD